jgi:hypothetical protein
VFSIHRFPRLPSCPRPHRMVTQTSLQKIQVLDNIPSVLSWEQIAYHSLQILVLCHLAGCNSMTQSNLTFFILPTRGLQSSSTATGLGMLVLDCPPEHHSERRESQVLCKHKYPTTHIKLDSSCWTAPSTSGSPAEPVPAPPGTATTTWAVEPPTAATMESNFPSESWIWTTTGWVEPCVVQ